MTSLWSKVAAFFKGGNASSGKTSNLRTVCKNFEGESVSHLTSLT